MLLMYNVDIMLLILYMFYISKIDKYMIVAENNNY